MAYALVGTIGGVSVGAASAAVTPVWGTGESRTANNLLICWATLQSLVTATTGTTVPTPSGWTAAVLPHDGTFYPTAGIFFKIATGGDAAPTFAAVTSQAWVVQLGEFSGGNSSSPLDQTGANNTVGNSIATWTVTCGAADAASGELVVTLNTVPYSTAATRTLTDSFNNGTLILSNNNSVSTTYHYEFGYCFSTSNAVAGSDAQATSTISKCTGICGGMASFLLPSAPATPLLSKQLRRRPPIILGRVSRGRF